MPRNGWIVVLAIGAASCGKSGATTPTHPPTGPTCTPVAATETTCSGGVDDDCDGFVDCLDTECDGQAVRRRADLQRRRLPQALRRRRHLRPRAAAPSRTSRSPRAATPRSSTSSRWRARSTTASTRSRPRATGSSAPAARSASRTASIAARAIACSRPARPTPPTCFDCSLTGCDNARHNYVRTADEAVLGYVFLTPGRRSPARLPRRQPERRRRLPQRRLGGAALPRGQQRRVRHRHGRRATRCSAKGWRDDGIAFYTRDERRHQDRLPHPVRARRRLAGRQRGVLLHRRARARRARRAAAAKEIADLGPRFKILATQAPAASRCTA